MDAFLTFLPWLGRFLIGFFFVFFGIWNTVHWHPTVTVMRQKGIPLAGLLLTFGIFLQTVCGLLLIFDFYAKLAAILLIPFTVIAVFIFHAFWKLEGEARVLNMLCFVTNLTSTLGALILLISSVEANTNLMQILAP